MGEYVFQCSIDMLKKLEPGTYLQCVSDTGKHIDLIFAVISSDRSIDFIHKSLPKTFYNYKYIDDEMYKTIVSVIKSENVSRYNEIEDEAMDIMEKKAIINIKRFFRITGLVCAPLIPYFYHKSQMTIDNSLFTGLSLLSAGFTCLGVRCTYNFKKMKQELEIQSDIRERKMELERRRIFKEL